MNSLQAVTRRAAWTAFLLFAAVLLVVAPAEASRTTADARPGLSSVSSEALLSPSLERPALGLATPALEPSRFSLGGDLGVFDTTNSTNGPGSLGLCGLEARRCAITYARNNPLRFVDPDGKDSMQFGKQTFTVFTGDALVMRTASGGSHVATYLKSGSGGQIMVFDSTKERNRNLDGIPDARAQIRMKAANPDNTGAKHEAHDLNSPMVNGKPSDYAAANGAIVLGVVPADRKVTQATLTGAAGTVSEYHGSTVDGNRQCSDYSADLSKAAGYNLPVRDPSSTTSYERAVDPTRVIDK